MQDEKVETRFRPIQPALQDFPAQNPHHRILLGATRSATSCVIMTSCVRTLVRYQT
jgi:hypothetical protein